MTVVPNRLVVLLVSGDEPQRRVIRSAFKHLSSFARLLVQSDKKQLVSCLLARNTDADREIWPLPDVLILQHSPPMSTMLDVLCWVRSELSLARLPVVMLNGGLSVSEAALCRRLNAIDCRLTAETIPMSELLEDGICRALRMPWDAPLGGASGWEPAVAAIAGPPEDEAIRVWT